MNNLKLNKTDGYFVLACGLLGAALNTFRLPLFFEAEFVFGPFLVLLVAVFRGPVAGLLTSMIATLPLALAWGSHWSTLTFGLEALFVGYVYAQRRSMVVLLVMVYWVFIGMPVSWYSISHYEHFLDSHRTAILIKQLANGILYAHITALLMYLPAVKKLFSKPTGKTSFSIKEQSFYIISSLLITAGILFFFINLNDNINHTKEEFNMAHQTSLVQTSTGLSLVMDTNLTAMSEFRHALSEVWDNPEHRQRLLLEYNQRHPAFRTMILSDSRGILLHSSPPELVVNVTSQNETIDISDRDYFKHAMASPRPYVSPGFVGRGFGRDLITAVSAGVPDFDQPSTRIGVVEGSFYLNTLKDLQAIINAAEPAVVSLLIDQNNKVLMASKEIAMTPLSDVSFVPATNAFYDDDLVSLNNAYGPLNDRVYYRAETEFDWGWKLVALQDESEFAKVVEKSLLVFAVSITLMVLAVTILARIISRSWTYYMHRLNVLIERGTEFNGEVAEFEENVNLPEEVSNLYKEIKSSRLEIIKINKELQDTVAERTERLQQANNQLNIMARKDALTQLDNRRVFNGSLNGFWQDCQKELLELSMMIVDIDHFKKVNDTYGHPVGDDILIQLAKILATYKKHPNQCVSRLGGEEFCVLLKGLGHEKAAAIAEQLRRAVENATFNVGPEKVICITVSIGLATINPKDVTAIKLYQLADTALYQAKNSGRNQVKSID